MTAATRLTLSGRSTDRLERLAPALGDRVVGTLSADVVAPDAPDRLVRAAYESLGRLDGAVYAAGVVAFGDLVDLDDDVLDQLVLVILMAPIRIARAAARILSAGGFVANLSAVVAEQPAKGMAAYSATKAGLTAFDKAAAAGVPPPTDPGDRHPPDAHRDGSGEPAHRRALAQASPGRSPLDVADRIVAAIAGDEKDLPAACFQNPPT